MLGDVGCPNVVAGALPSAPVGAVAGLVVAFGAAGPTGAFGAAADEFAAGVAPLGVPEAPAEVEGGLDAAGAVAPALFVAGLAPVVGADEAAAAAAFTPDALG